MFSLITLLLAQKPGETNSTINLRPATGTVGATSSGFTISGILATAINLVLVLSAVAFFVMLVIGGIRWITSGGDKAQTEAARSQITAALVGLVIVFAAYALTVLAGNIFGFNIFELKIPTIPQG